MNEVVVQGKNAVLEALRGCVKVREIYIDSNGTPDDKIAEILLMASAKGVPVRKVGKPLLRRLSPTFPPNIPVLAYAQIPPLPTTLAQLLRQCEEKAENPFIVMLGKVDYRQNLGAVVRTANAAGVHGVVVPRSRRNPVTPEVVRVSMGAALFTPIVRASPYSALKTLRSAGLHIIGADMEGRKPYYEADLRGSVAIVLGGEDRRLAEPIMKRCDETVRIPMSGLVSSLNLSVACSILVYEKVRQESMQRT